MRICDWSSDVCSSDLAMIVGCDTSINVVDSAGIIVGANVQATSNLCLSKATNRGSYQNCMDTYKDRLLAAGLVTGRQADRKSVVSGKSVSVRVDLGGRRIIKKKK